MEQTEKIKYKYWQDNSDWIGYLIEYPDYMTQGTTLEDLRRHLTDLYIDQVSHLNDIL